MKCGFKIRGRIRLGNIRIGNLCKKCTGWDIRAWVCLLV